MKKMLITLSLVALVTTAFAWDGRGMNDGQKIGTLVNDLVKECKIMIWKPAGKNWN